MNYTSVSAILKYLRVYLLISLLFTLILEFFFQDVSSFEFNYKYILLILCLLYLCQKTLWQFVFSRLPKKIQTRAVRFECSFIRELYSKIFNLSGIIKLNTLLDPLLESKNRKINIDKNITIVLVLLLITIGALVRLHNIGNMSLWADEAINGRVAVGWLTQGTPGFRSGDGQFSPYVRGRIHTFLTAVSIALFGQDEFAVRFPGVFFGVIGVLAAFLFGTIHLDRLFGIIFAFFVAFHPWQIEISRYTRFYSTIQVVLFVGVVSYALWSSPVSIKKGYRSISALVFTTMILVGIFVHSYWLLLLVVPIIYEIPDVISRDRQISYIIKTLLLLITPLISLYIFFFIFLPNITPNILLNLREILLSSGLSISLFIQNFESILTINTFLSTVPVIYTVYLVTIKRVSYSRRLLKMIVVTVYIYFGIILAVSALGREVLNNPRYLSPISIFLLYLVSILIYDLATKINGICCAGNLSFVSKFNISVKNTAKVIFLVLILSSVYAQPLSGYITDEQYSERPLEYTQTVQLKDMGSASMYVNKRASNGDVVYTSVQSTTAFYMDFDRNPKYKLRGFPADQRFVKQRSRDADIWFVFYEYYKPDEQQRDWIRSNSKKVYRDRNTYVYRYNQSG